MRHIGDIKRIQVKVEQMLKFAQTYLNYATSQLKAPRRVTSFLKTINKPLISISLLSLFFIITSSLWLTNSRLVYAGDFEFDGPQGFDQYLTSVAEIQSRGRDEDLVKMRGRLTNYIKKDRYEFVDESGNSIEVELDDDYNWSGIHKDQLIMIYGEVDKNMFWVKIEAKGYAPIEIPGDAPNNYNVVENAQAH